MKKSIKAYAKVNIGLKIVGKREDDYHLLSSYFLLIPLYDEIEVEIEKGEYSVSIEGNDYINNETDLMVKACNLFTERTGLSFKIKIKIKKNIPLRAGLGGGSSDASSILVLLNSYFSYFSTSELISFSSLVGADCPFFVSGYKLAYVSGIGEIVEEREWNMPYSYITLFRRGDKGTSTKEAYRKIDKEKGSIEDEILPSLSYPIKRSSFPNDFEKVEGIELYESLKDYLEIDDYLSLSGSGSVWFLLSKKEWQGDRKYLISTNRL